VLFVCFIYLFYLFILFVLYPAEEGTLYYWKGYPKTSAPASYEEKTNIGDENLPRDIKVFMEDKKFVDCAVSWTHIAGVTCTLD
jgi:hypothetical protein